MGKDKEIGDETLDEVTTLFYDYVCEHQGEATEDDRWRYILMRKITLQIRWNFETKVK